MEGTFVPEGCALTRRMVKGDGRPGRGRCLAEEDEDEYDLRIEWPPGDFIAAFKRQVKRDRIQEIKCMHGSRICRSGRVDSLLL